MSNSASLTSGVAGRYATALFEIARENGALEKLESDRAALADLIAESEDFRHVIASPIHSREDQKAAIAQIAGRLGLGTEMQNTLGLMAENRRLFVLSDFARQLRALIADDRGEMTAEVTSARPLSDSQLSDLRASLKSGIGKDIELDVKVDESLIGGLIVSVGSRMIDTSIRSQLANLQNAMKEAG